MTILQETWSQIAAPDMAIMTEVGKTIEQAVEPGKLGRLRDLVAQYAGIVGQAAPPRPRCCMVVACADHGVARQPISAYPIEATAQMSRNYVCSQGASANALANFSGSDIVAVDAGIAADMSDVAGLWHRKIAYGTQDFTTGPAMTRDEAARALEIGIEIVRQKVEEGYTCFSLGEMGIGNTTSSAAIVSAFTALTPEQATGRGTGISDSRLAFKIGIVKQALAVNRPDRRDGLDVLAKVGGFEIGTLAGVVLGAAAHRCMVMIDGLNTTAAALIAYAIHPLARHYLAPSHLSGEPAHRTALNYLGLAPMLDLGVKLGEAIGASFVVKKLDFAVQMLETIQTGRIAAPQASSVVLPRSASAVESIWALASATAARIQPLNAAVMERCQLRIDNLTKPLGSLQALEYLAAKAAGATENPRPRTLAKRVVFIAAGDGDAAPAMTTERLVAVAAQHAGASFLSVRLPARDALSADAYTALLFAQGQRLAQEAANDGMQVLSISAAACGDLPAAAALLSLYTNIDLVRICDMADDEAVYEAACQYYEAWQEQPPGLSLLAQTGAGSLALLAGLLLGAAANRMLLVIDGLLSNAAAAIVRQAAPLAAEYMVGSHYAAQSVHQEVLAALSVPAYFHLELAGRDGIGAALGLYTLDASLHMLNDMKTFGEADVAVAEDGLGALRQDKRVRD